MHSHLDPRSSLWLNWIHMLDIWNGMGKCLLVNDIHSPRSSRQGSETHGKGLIVSVQLCLYRLGWFSRRWKVFYSRSHFTVNRPIAKRTPTDNRLAVVDVFADSGPQLLAFIVTSWTCEEIRKLRWIPQDRIRFRCLFSETDFKTYPI